MSRLDELRSLYEKATPGPWGVWSVERGPDDEVTHTDWGVMGAQEPIAGGGLRVPNVPQGEADAELIAAMHEAMPAMLDILIDFAATPEPIEWYSMGGIYGCTLCDGKGTRETADFRHSMLCPWRRVVDLTR